MADRGKALAALKARAGPASLRASRSHALNDAYMQQFQSLQGPAAEDAPP